MMFNNLQAIWRIKNIVISIVINLLIVGLCFYIGVLYTNQMMLTIGYAYGILLVVSLVELIYRVFTLKCSIEIPISMSEHNRPVNVVIRTKNKGVLPVGRVELRVKRMHVFQQKKRTQWISLCDVPQGNSKHVEKMVFKGAGCHEIATTHVKIYGLFGFLSIKRRCKDFAQVLIMPEIYAANIEIGHAVRNFIGEADVYDEFRPGHDSGETFEIREYREKDKLQSIHWKLSAKTDELMVKENSLPKACAVILMLEMHPKVLDGFFELAASISFSLMDQRCPHFVAWYSVEEKRIRRIRVDDEESFYLFLDVYLRDAIPCEENVRERYRDAYKNECYLYDVTINEKLELYKNGEFAIRLDEKKIKDECEKLELIL